MHLRLKEYQERTLETLTEYYQKCLQYENANTAFYELTQRPYAAVEGLPGMPYIFLCFVAEMRSSTAVEQILGRVMRLPKAKRKKETFSKS